MQTCTVWARVLYLLDVLHDTADDNVALLVTQSIHVQLGGAVQVFVNQHRLLGVNLDSSGDVPADVDIHKHII